MDIRVLGSVTVTDGGDVLGLGGPKQRTVLAVLIANVGQAVTVESLIQAVYGDDAPARRRRTIQTYVSALRSVVGDAIVKRGSSWALDIDPLEIDAVRFEALVESSRSIKPDDAAETLRESLAMWHGYPYPDVEAHGYLDAEITRLQELRLSALHARIEADLALGHHAALVGEVASLLAEHPFRESFRAQHMLALYRSGRQREALASYQEMRSLLVEELGADPSPELRELEQRIIDQHESLNLKPVRSIQRRAILVADLGDPLRLGRISPAERERRLAHTTSVLTSLAEDLDSDHLHAAGAASYLVFASADQALATALRAASELEQAGVRMAIDWGDIEADDEGITGPPVSRSAALVSAAHPGQVLISGKAHRELLATSEATGLRFESLGSHQLHGVEEPVRVLQLLIGDPPRSFAALENGRLPPALPWGRHRSVPGYELREDLGEGSVGTLHRAYQASVGREVIIEVIPRSVASDPDFIRNFEADAHRLALLDHPHINPVLDYWRDPDGACVVYRNRRGGLLGGGADGSPELLEQIGSALAYTHSYGIAHGSVRPDRIVLDESGFGYLIGFPLAGLMPRSSPHYPEYIAPETLAGAEPSVAADIYALGALGHEIVAGAGDEDRPPAPRRLSLAKALEEDPGNRQRSVAEFLEALSPTGDGAARPYSEVRNPYKGLAAFHERDAPDFFGRSDLTSTLVESLARSGFLAVIGPSGVGKSSVVRAGLLPAVRNGAIDGSRSWVVTDMLPGSHPFLELRRALERVVIDLPPAVVEGLVYHNPDSLVELRHGLPRESELLLVIDQFEELFTLCEPQETSRFVDLLVAVVKSGQARVVLTLRADFLDRPLQHSGLGELIGENVVTVASPSRDELAEAIAGPAESLGVTVDGGLVERICTDVHDRPGALPLLQHALVELFESRAINQLTLEQYEAIGGVTGSLERRAEACYRSLDDELRAVTERAMLRLVAVFDDGAPIRRRVRLFDFNEAEARVLEVFVAARLLVNDVDPETRAPTVEVAHEALLTHWPRLAAWIETHRSELTLHSRLADATAEWENANRAPDHLLSGGRLAQHEAWAPNSNLVLSDSEHKLLDQSRIAADEQAVQRQRRRALVLGGFAGAFLVASVLALLAVGASRRADDGRLAAEQAEQAAAEQSALAVQERNRAEANADEAQQQRRVAEGRALLAAVPSATVEDPQLALLLAINAADRLGDVPAATAALHDTLAAQRTIYQTEWTGDLINGFEVEGDLSADGTLLAVVGPAGSAVEVHDVDDGELLWKHEFDVDRPLEYKVMAQFIGDGEQLLLGLSWHPEGDRAIEPPSSQLGFHILDSRTGVLLRRYDGGPCGPVGKRLTRWGAISEAAESATVTMGISQGWFDQFGCAPADPTDGNASPYPEIDIMRVELATGESTPIVSRWGGDTLTVAMSGDGLRAALGLAASPPGTFTVIDIETGDVLNIIANDTTWPGLLLDHDGSAAGTQGATEGESRWFDADSGTLIRTVPDPETGVRLTGAWLSADASALLLSDQGGTLRVTEAVTGDEVTAIPSDGPIGVVRATPDLGRVATFGAASGRAVIVSAVDSELDEVAHLDPCEDAGLPRKFYLNRGLAVRDELLTVMAFCDPPDQADADLPISTFDGATHSPAKAYTYSTATGELLAEHPAFGQTFAVADSGTSVMQTWTQTDNDSWVGGQVRVVDLRSGEILDVLSGVCELDLARYRLDDELLECDGTGVAIDNAHVSVSSDGEIAALVSSRQPTLGRVWNSATGNAADLAAPIGALGVSPDGSLLAVAEQFEPSLGGVGKLQLYSTEDFGLVTESGPTAERVRGGLVFTPDGQHVAVIAGEVGTAIRIHDVDAPDVSRRLTEPHEVLTTGFSFDSTGKLLATAGGDGFARLWDLETLDLVHEINVGGLVTAIAFLDDDRQLAVATRTGGVEIFHVELEGLLREARLRIQRGFTETECVVYFPDGGCPTVEEVLGLEAGE